MMSAEFTEYTDPNGKPNMPKSCLGFSDWLIQTHLSLGSLLAKSCQSAMILAGHSKSFEESAYTFGENTIYAQQVFLFKKNVGNIKIICTCDIA